MPNCVCGRPPAVGLPFLGGWWEDLHSGQRKTLHYAKRTNEKKTENRLRSITSSAAALRRAANWMMVLGQSVRGPHSWMIERKAWGKLPVSDCRGVWRSGAEVSSGRRSPWVNLRQSLRVGAWNALFRREDDHLSLLSSELKRFNIGIAALSEVRRPDSGDIMVGGLHLLLVWSL